MNKSYFAGALAAVLCLGANASTAQTSDLSSRLPEDEIIYVVMPDRFANGDPTNDTGGLSGDRLVTGYDPTSKGFYHGGDIRGLIDKLDYIQGLGVTAIWLTPVFQNKAVQGASGHETAGYHGYWGTDFTRIDPHLGDMATYQEFVSDAHARGMKVYFDIVINHTADVIQYRECSACGYRSTANYPYGRRGGLAGAAINPGFDGANSDRLTDPTWAYTPFVPAGQEHVKKPEWLNDVSVYHNRGDSTFADESSLLGDFMGLDDVMTENPRVVQGFIDLYGDWIDKTHVDGFRIDTARHVNPAFWRAFVPAMHARAEAAGIAHFHIFGEVMVFNSGQIANYTDVNGFDSLNDFPLRQAIVDVVAEGEPVKALIDIFAVDDAFAGGSATAGRLVTLTGNHDVLRLGRDLRSQRPNDSEADLVKRMILAHAIMLTSRGVPALYYGDEQGFTGQGDIDQDSREDMFPSLVASYNDNRLIGSSATTAQDNFDQNSVLYKAFSELTALRRGDIALRRGRQIIRPIDGKPQMLAYSRILAGELETVVVVNTGTTVEDVNVTVESQSGVWIGLYGSCPSSKAPGVLSVAVQPLGFVVCKAG